MHNPRGGGSLNYAAAVHAEKTMFRNRFPIVFRDAEDKGGGGETPPAGGETTPPETTPPSKTYTQEEWNKATEAARKDGEKRGAAQAKKDADEAARIANMSAAEKLEADIKAANDRADTATNAANAKLIRADAKEIAGKLGCADIAAAIALAKLDGITIGEDGEPDAKEIEAAIKAVLTAHPFLKGTPGVDRTGGEFTNPGAPPDIDAQIQAALKAGDAGKAIALKNQKFNI